MQRMVASMPAAERDAHMRAAASVSPDQLRAAADAMRAAGPDGVRRQMEAATGAAAARAKYALDASTALKAQGNAAFSRGDLETAVERWERVVANLDGAAGADAGGLLRSCRLNLSLAYLNDGRHALCEAHATAVLAVAPGDRKALYRRGAARLAGGGDAHGAWGCGVALPPSQQLNKRPATAAARCPQVAATPMLISLTTPGWFHHQL